MQIVQAAQHQFVPIMTFYETMCRVLGEQPFLPNGNHGGFPAPSMVEAAIRSGSQFIGVEAGKIIAAYILNHDCDDAYRGAPWQIQAADDEVVIMHALRVLPEYSGRGYAKQLLAHAIQTAREQGARAVRLDCLKENTAAVKLYTALGFQLVDTVSITYADIGCPMECLLYERVL